MSEVNGIPRAVCTQSVNQFSRRFKTALEIQDACNLTAVAGVFHEMCLEVLAETHSTVAVAKDPAILWMVDKIHDLVGRPDGAVLNRAYDTCLQKSESKLYKVTTGPFMGLSFKGYPIIINGEERIWDDDSVGISHPATSCIVVE